MTTDQTLGNPVITEEMRAIARTYRSEPFTYVVERGRIRDVANAVGDPNPLWHDPAYARSLGYRDVVAPPVFLKSYEPFYNGQEWPIPGDFKYAFSASDGFETHRPIQAGDVLTSVARVDDLWEKRSRPGIGRMLFVRFEYTYTNQNGEVVGKGYWTRVSYEG